MNTPINTACCTAPEFLESIADAIRSVSAKSRGTLITPGSLLLEELALDSLDLVAVILELQDRFEIEIEPDDIPQMRTVADLAATLASHLRSAA